LQKAFCKESNKAELTGWRRGENCNLFRRGRTVFCSV